MIAALRDRGWGSRNLVVDLRYTQGNPEHAERLAKELVNERVDVIVTVVTATAMAARRATNVLPIVMYVSGYPVEGGLAASLAQPGGNVTGMTVYADGGGLFGKFLELLRELLWGDFHVLDLSVGRGCCAAKKGFSGFSERGRGPF